MPLKGGRARPPSLPKVAPPPSFHRLDDAGPLLFFGGFFLLIGGALALAPGPQLNQATGLAAGTAFGALGARALWSAALYLRQAPMDIGVTRSPAGRIGLFSRADRSLFAGGISTTASAALLVVGFPAGAQPSGQQFVIATLIFGLGALLPIVWVLEARERRALAVRKVRAALGAAAVEAPMAREAKPESRPWQRLRR